MGNGSTLVLFNGTHHDWTLEGTSSYQMNSWDGHFPKYIAAGELRFLPLNSSRMLTILLGTAAFVYFEYDQRPFKKRSDTSAQASYQSDSLNFKVIAKDGPERASVEVNGVKTPENPSGNRFEQQLTWIHNGWTPFQLVSRGDTGTYLTHALTPDWMQRNLDWLGHRPLHTICMPGSHDAGMSIISQVFADDIGAIRDFMGPLCQCQAGSVAEQLQWGSRYFDVRPFISGGEFWTGHYTGTLGGRGQSISSIVDNINQFTNRYNELVIVNLSHECNSDEKSGKAWRQGFNQQEWNKLASLLCGLNHRWLATTDREADLSTLTLNEFIGNGKPAVIIIADVSDLSMLGLNANEGFFLPRQLNTFDQYSDSPDVNVMVGNQLQKMRDFMNQKDQKIFLLSWTLTQHTEQIVQTILINNLKLDPMSKQNFSIAGLAAQANQALFQFLLPSVSEKAFPNIIYLDYLHGSYLFAGVALAANAKANF